MRRGTFNQAEQNGLCSVHLWQVEALQLSPDFWRSWYERWQGQATKRVPRVLQADFELNHCAVCGNVILPWRRRRYIPKLGTMGLAWVTPKLYHRRRTCHNNACHGELNKSIGSGKWTGVGEMRRGR